MCVRLPTAGSRGLCAAQPLLRTNVSRNERPAEMLRTLSEMPWMPKYAIGWVPPLQPLICAPEKAATARNTVARAHAIA
jgi:hypothetical protein